MPKATRAKTADEASMEEESPPVQPPTVDPALYATLMSVISTQIAQGFKALQTGNEAIPSTSASSDQGASRKRRPSTSDDSSESDRDEYHGEATFERRARRGIIDRKKNKMSMRMAYGEVGDGLPKSTVEKKISTDYMPIRCLRRSHILDINVDPSALGEDKTKQEVVPVTEIDEWLELFMIYSAVRARRFPMEGHQLISYMKHVKTIAQRKGSDVAIEYDGQFRLQRLPEGVAWDDFQYDLYEQCQSYCESKRKRAQKPFRAGRRGENAPRFCFAFNKGN